MFTRDHNRRANLARLARVKNVEMGDVIRFHEYDSSSSHYTIAKGEYFVAENPYGYFIQGKIIDIKNERHGDDRDEVIFDYEISTDGGAEFRAL